ncbi:MAG: type II CAAX endopeptidase family protein [Clostridia bacterium]|nr:type II CAAX endopeptidase family protein [Clostridia bacterium]
MLSRYKSNMTAPLLASVAYLLLLLSRIIKITDMTGQNKYVGLIVLQIVIFLLPAVIYSKLKGENYSRRLRLRPLGAQQTVVALLGALTLICGSLLLSILFAGGVGNDEFSLYNTFNAAHDGSAESFLYVTIAYAALPAICEEFFFRSVMSAEYEEYGIGTALVMSSLLFGMIHFNFSQLIIYFFAGAVLFAVMYATRSLVGSILVHFLFNMYGLFGQNFLNEVYRTTGSTEVFLLLLTAAFLLFTALLCGEIARLYRRYSVQNKSSDYLPKKDTGRGKKKDKNRVGITESVFAPPCLVIYLVFFLAAIFG